MQVGFGVHLARPSLSEHLLASRRHHLFQARQVLASARLRAALSPRSSSSFRCRWWCLDAEAWVRASSLPLKCPCFSASQWAELGSTCGYASCPSVSISGSVCLCMKLSARAATSIQPIITGLVLYSFFPLSLALVLK